MVSKVRIDGSLISDKAKGSIHTVGAEVQGLSIAMVGHFGTQILRDKCSNRYFENSCKK